MGINRFPFSRVHSSCDSSSVLGVSATASYAQLTRGVILGSVQDPSAAVIANASVKIVNSATHAERATTTNAEGLYRFDGVDPSVYSVTFSAQTKGKQVYVEGRLQTGNYEDRDGAKRYITEIVAEGVILLGGQQGGSQDQSGKGNNNGLVSQPRGRAAATIATAPDDPGGPGITDDDIPF